MLKQLRMHKIQLYEMHHNLKSADYNFPKIKCNFNPVWINKKKPNIKSIKLSFLITILCDAESWVIYQNKPRLFFLPALITKLCWNKSITVP